MLYLFILKFTFHCGNSTILVIANLSGWMYKKDAVLTHFLVIERVDYNPKEFFTDVLFVELLQSHD